MITDFGGNIKNNEVRKVHVAWMDNTRAKGLPATLFARGQYENRLGGLRDCIVDNHRIIPEIIDPFPFPINPLRHKHSIYAGIDPLVKFVLLKTSSADVNPFRTLSRPASLNVTMPSSKAVFLS